jgi:hypothetical protein
MSSSSLLRACVRLLLPLLTVGAAVGGASAAAAATPIGPNQFFDGVVNGATANAVIQMACFGPTFPGQTGHPLPNQWVLVHQVTPPTTTQVGFTGAAGRSVVVSLRLSTSTAIIVIGSLTAYDTRLLIPTSLTLPCYASGQVVFTPAPTSSTARPDVVAVHLSGQP